MPRAALLLALLLGGCANLAYYTQAVSGHLQVMHASRPIPRLLDSPATDPDLRTKLEKVTAMREFASRELALPDNGSYRRYADLGRPYVVWNVFAAKELSVDLKEWCLFIIGCVSYRGYYHRDAAEDLARELQSQGLETYVGAIPAYSTLGLFDDPVLNTFLRFGDLEVARVIFHELAHQVVYIRGDSTFNESFATAVENEGMRRWLDHAGTPEQYREFEIRQRRKAQFLSLLTGYREKLKALYARPLPDEEKRRGKADILAGLRQAYASLKAEWGGYSGYDGFFDAGLNNAKLGSVSLYSTLVPAFERLLQGLGRDLPSFYRCADSLAHVSKERRQAVLQHPETAGELPDQACAKPAQLPLTAPAGTAS